VANRLAVVRGAVRGRAPRRSTEWLASADVTTFTTLAASGVVLSQFFAFLEPATIIRTRGSLWVKSDQVAAQETSFGALGFSVVTNQANAIGVTAVPTPITDEASDEFFVWMPFATLIETTVGAIKGFEYPFDSKAMRKVTSGQTTVVTLENASLVGLEFLIKFRMLVKLHG